LAPYFENMELIDAVARAALEGLTSVLPLSDSGHRLLARVWLGDTRGMAAPLNHEDWARLMDVGCLLALIVAMRGRLGTALSEGIRGIAKPAVLQESDGGRDAVAVVLAALAASCTEVVMRPFASTFNDVPLVVGVALLMTAAGLTSTLLAPTPRLTSPTPVGALLVGLAHGLAIVPGASQIGAAYVAMRWMGISGWNAAELAMLATIPVMTLRAGLLLFEGVDGTGLPLAQIALALCVTFVTASLAASWWRSLADKSRTSWLSLWLVPLSLAMLAYGRALPTPTDHMPISQGAVHP
jgi:undecaprenyl-diphosphatase